MTSLLTLVFVFAAGDWGDVQRIPADRKIEVTTRDRATTKARFVSATPDAVVVREASGEHSLGRTEIRRVRIEDPSRRIRNGAIWTAVGTALGAGIGVAVCPYCSNEGHGSKYVGPGAAIGAGLGALGFLAMPYRTVYRSK